MVFNNFISRSSLLENKNLPLKALPMRPLISHQERGNNGNVNIIKVRQSGGGICLESKQGWESDIDTDIPVYAFPAYVQVKMKDI